MGKLLHPQTETDPECLTVEGERRLGEILDDWTTDEEKVEQWMEDYPEQVLGAYFAAPFDMYDNLRDQMRDYHRDDAMNKIREEDYSGV